MKKLASSDVRIRHKATKLWLEVENLGRPRAEHDVYVKKEDDASIFKTKQEAIVAAKRLGLRKEEFEIV